VRSTFSMRPTFPTIMLGARLGSFQINLHSILLAKSQGRSQYVVHFRDDVEKVCELTRSGTQQRCGRAEPLQSSSISVTSCLGPPR